VKTFPLTTPETPGVYALIHRGSGTCFVGPSDNLRQRQTVWRSLLRRGKASDRVKGFPDHPMEEWEFKIIQASEGLTREQMEELVDQTIRRALRQGLKVINRAARAPEMRERHAALFDARLHALKLMPVPILDEAGNAMTYAEAAAATGRSVDSVKDVAKRIRLKAEQTVLILDKITLEQIRTQPKR
jgi:hypothetical protein